MKHESKNIITMSFLILLLGIFIIVNISGFKKNYNGSITTTTKVLEPVTKDILYEDAIFIDGEKATIYSVEYISHLGFKIKYDSSNFNVKYLSNGTLLVESKNDDKNYIKIDRLQENDYYKQYAELNLKKDVVDNHLVNYIFLKGGYYNYIKVTKSINQDDKVIDAHLDYIVNSLSFTS